ncbi:Outer membrane receptor proteins, mostly Fe transport [Mesonia phycicola]|uniref:Outer membrane receptor proteins, mostly Fe transport n=1 Tax=Mesonia phycicola TaxID=579105 RepID=A0A1M6A3D2_9FLAO|nr:TonB-dependent receptor [Mesonia phycicola]SHI31011.1 Outer membrane receptor proteins, mostly Fe transport [Mesonia phycicola]
MPDFQIKLSLFFLLFISSYSTIYSQTIEGTVVDQYDISVLGVQILNKSNNQHTHSDARGYFQLSKTKIGDTLVFSHTQFKNQPVIIQSLEEPLKIYLNRSSISLDEVVITDKINALHLISDIDIQINPVNSSQDILRKVPGLFIGQHAGGGKAEQIFLRGFDIDHGTDISINVDGMPVNMVSHAHGQGYSDLHFVIPETIEKIDFGKGPYNEDKGNFATAGFVDFKTKSRLDNSSIKLEAGQFNSQRLLGMFNLLNDDHQNAYVASEYISTDGPFDSPQNFHRINLFGKYTAQVNDRDKIGITASYFTSTWDASGQIPVRAVESGLIGRFGAIDDTEGGTTGRKNILVNYDRVINETSSIKNNIYYSQYDFELYSNFTFFLDDPINGDQIKQKENREIYGVNSEYKKDFFTNTIEGNFTAGISLRNDVSKNNELSHTLNRSTTLNQIQFGDINETNFGAYLGTQINIKKWTFNPTLRVDYFNFMYNDHLQTTYETQTNTKTVVSPKFNILYNQSEDLQLYLKTGKGFHSNDTRVVVAEDGVNILPAAYGLDLGYIWKISPKMLLNMAYWYLYLEQEFVYVGDAGIVEPSGKTRRQGIDLSYRYQPTSSLFWNLDVNYTYARAIDEADGQDYIPLAPDFTLVSGINFKHKSGIYGSTNVRYLKDRPANEDNSIVAEGYTVVDLNAGYRWKNLEFGIQIQNLLNTEWNETQFATESRLQNEANSVEEIHFTPGTPFFAKGTIQYNF